MLAYPGSMTLEKETFEDMVYEIGRFQYGHERTQEELSGRFMILWKREDGVWRAHREISNF